MTEDEIIEKAEALPDRFADRVTESTLWSIKRMRGGGEYGELTVELLRVAVLVPDTVVWLVTTVVGTTVCVSVWV